MPNWGKHRWFFVPCDLEILWMTLKNNRAHLLYHVRLCAWFQIHRWIKIGVTVRKHTVPVKISDFLSCVTLEFDGRPWKTIGHLFYAASSFVHNFIAIIEFKLKLQFGNVQFGSKSTIFGLCDLEIWWMTLKNNRASLLCFFKLCASFRSHWRIQTGVTVRRETPNLGQIWQLF